MVIRNSVKAIIIQDNKLLVTKLQDEDGMYYLLPGGGQEVGEKMHDTVIRECMEETGFVVEVQELMFIRECFLVPGIHRVEMMFRCHVIGESQITNMDPNQLDVEWIDMDKIEDEPLFPAELRTRIKRSHLNMEHPVYLGEIQ